MRTYRVADWMSTPPILIRSTTTLADAQRIMEHRKVRRPPVVEDGRLVAIVTWGDLRAAQPSAATTLSIHEWRALLDRDERREAIPGQHCPAFTYLPMRAASLGVGEH